MLIRPAHTSILLPWICTHPTRTLELFFMTREFNGHILVLRNPTHHRSHVHKKCVLHKLIICKVQQTAIKRTSRHNNSTNLIFFFTATIKGLSVISVLYKQWLCNSISKVVVRVDSIVAGDPKLGIQKRA